MNNFFAKNHNRTKLAIQVLMSKNIPIRSFSNLMHARSAYKENKNLSKLIFQNQKRRLMD